MLDQIRSAALSVWRLPAAPDARPPGRVDYAFVAVAAAVALVEVAVLRPDVPGRWLSLAAFLVWLPTLLVRRTRPLLTTGTFVVVVLVLWAWSGITGSAQPGDIHTAVVALLIPYSLARFASGQHAVAGFVMFWAAAGTSLVSQDLPTADRIGGTAVIVAAIAVGAALRFRSMLHTRQLVDVRRDERERLARDLHDTVAHHLTAIAISAQAGLAVADTRPDAARDALRRIDEEATRTLAETRKVLRVLRTEEVPERPLDDLAGLAAPGGPGPAVVVEVDDDLDLSPAVAASLHRIAREAVANARRHAVDATLVEVDVRRRAEHVELTVSDDGRSSTGIGEGFGVVGMTERAELLGGRLTAGRAAGGGWRVTARLPVEQPR